VGWLLRSGVRVYACAYVCACVRACGRVHVRVVCARGFVACAPICSKHPHLCLGAWLLMMDAMPLQLMAGASMVAGAEVLMLVTQLMGSAGGGAEEGQALLHQSLLTSCHRPCVVWQRGESEW